MDKKTVQTLTAEKLFTSLNKYRQHPETVYLKAVDFVGNVIFDDILKVDLFKIDKFIKELHKLSEVYKIDVVIRYRGFSSDEVVITFKHSL